MKWTTNWLCLLAICLSTLLAGCGAGNGGGAASYTITLRADRTSLPLDIGGQGPSIGGQYTATLYVEAHDDLGNPIPGGDDIFSCNVASGLDSGALFYLDGDPDHETTVTINGVDQTVPTAYRNITLGANSGGQSFHFSSRNIVGTVTIRCVVTDPSTETQRSAQVTIQVGGPASGKVSQILFNQVNANYSGYIWIQGLGGETQVQVQAQLVDEAGQPVPNPAFGVDNLQVRIVPDVLSLADDDATLRAVNGSGQTVSGQSLFVQSINGQAQFTLVSGTNPGPILLEAVADRSDNNVGNGLAEPIFNLSSGLVVATVPVTPTAVTITTASLPAATGSIPYGALLQASGGSAPYTWSLVAEELPGGLTLSPDGVISGTPTETISGTYNFVLQVVDALGTTVQKGFSIAYTAVAPVPTPAPTAPTVTTSTLSGATECLGYATALTATGGTAPYTWTYTAEPSIGLTFGSDGIVSGTPAPNSAATYAFVITVRDFNFLSSSRGVTLTVADDGVVGPCP